ncbi:preprotein translocase subunit YajC [Cytophagaceae bacterium ABcell3]|nr:preprotein translocase subunit YajC [Cytophagaceae bacterium ABcell3]
MLNLIFLQADPGGGGMSTLILFAAIIVIFYFFMIRPQQKKQKEQKAYREGLKKGDSVVTIGGLHGRISSIESDDTIILEVDKGVKLKFEKSSVSMEVSKKAQDSK